MSWDEGWDAVRSYLERLKSRGPDKVLVERIALLEAEMDARPDA